MKDFPLFIEDYLNYMESIRGVSKNTVREYSYDIRTFFRFLKIRYKIVSNDVEFDSIDISDISLSFMNNITIQDLHSYIHFTDKERSNSNSTKSRKISSLKSLFNYLFSIVKLIDSNPAINLEYPKAANRYPSYLSLEESERLLSTVLKNKNEQYKKRDFAIIMLFLNTGLRLSELSKINLSDIKEDKKISILGKGNKERMIFLNDATYRSIKDYINNARPEENNDPEALFISKQKNRMSNRAIQHMVDRYLDKAGLDSKKYSVHKLRHTAATLMYKYGDVDIRALQEILGHESISTTQIYTHLDDERLRSAVDSNPLSQIQLDQ